MIFANEAGFGANAGVAKNVQLADASSTRFFWTFAARSEDSPMRRGLKSYGRPILSRLSSAIRRFPDEEGTEMPVRIMRSKNAVPDQKIPR